MAFDVFVAGRDQQPVEEPVKESATTQPKKDEE